MTDRISIDERKYVTVLFADLSGFTALSEELDPEEISDLLNRYFETIATVVKRYDGHINQYVGDEIMVLFGAPIAHEDDPERAVRAALEIMEAVERADSDVPGDVLWHIGVNSGLVVAGEVGASHKREYTVIGDTVNTASRILDAAKGGQILVGESVYQRTRDVFDFVRFGAVQMKGKRDKVEVYQPVRALPRQRRLELSLQRSHSRLLGRQQELDTLTRALESTKTDGLQVVAVQAPAGSGKSRLLYEFRQLLPEGVQFMEGDAIPFGEVSAYQPLLDLLRRYWGLATQVGELGEEKLTEILSRFDMLDHRIVFEDLFALTHSDEGYEKHSPQRRRMLTVAALLAFFEKVAGSSTVVVAIDDLQWADQSTLEFIGALIEKLPGSGLLLILLARPEFEWPWSDNQAFSLLTPAPLGASESAALVRDLLSGPPSKELVDYIVERTEGNPFFTEELVRALEEGEALEELEGEYRLADPADSLGLPETVQGVISARIDRLASEPKQVLETAGIIGRGFASDVLERVLDVDSSWLEAQLAVLVKGQFIQPPNGELETYQFVHGLTRDVAYSLPLNRVRRRIHADVARVLEELTPEMLNTHPEILAQHYTQARLVDQAVPLWQRAAERAIQRSANAEAIAHVWEALALIRSSKVQPDAELELQLLTTLAVALLTTRGFTSPEVQEAYSEAREVAARVKDPAMLAPALRGLWIFHNMRGDYELADQLSKELFDLAEQAEDTGLILEARRAIGITALARGDLVSAESHLLTGLELSEVGDHRDHIHLYGQDPLVANLVQMGWLLAMKGDLVEAVKHIERAVKIAREIGHPFTIAGALLMASLVESLCYGWDNVGKYGNQCIDVAGEHQFGFMMAHALVIAAWSRASEAETPELIAEAVEAMQSGLEAYDKSGASWILPYYEAGLASQLGRLGRVDQALAVVEQGLVRAETTGEMSWTAEALRVRSTLLGAHNPIHEDVERDLRDAVKIAQGQGALTFQLAAALQLAEALSDQGKPGDQDDELRRLLDSFNAETDHTLVVAVEEYLSGG